MSASRIEESPISGWIPTIDGFEITPVLMESKEQAITYAIEQAELADLEVAVIDAVWVDDPRESTTLHHVGGANMRPALMPS